MLKLRTDIPYSGTDGKMTQAGVQAIQGQFDAQAASVATVAADVTAIDTRVTTLEGQLASGQGQTWTDVTGSRALGTSYQNTTGRPITIDPRATTSGASHMVIEVSPNNSTWTIIRKVNHNVGSTFTDTSFGHVQVLDDQYYRFRLVSGSGTLTAWMELR